jgi:GTP-binding protein
MRARAATFVASAAEPRGFPAADLPEVAIAGRSNVGKSSLINTLIGTPVARTSGTPGRTRLLNWFRVESPKGGALHLVDLPGYGYAKVPTDMRESWRPLIEAYLTGRSTLRGVVVLVDARRGAEDEERDLIGWLLQNGVPVVPVLTKADKLAKNKRKPAAAELRRALELPRDPLLVSSLSGDGVDDLWRTIFSLALRPET